MKKFGVFVIAGMLSLGTLVAQEPVPAPTTTPDPSATATSGAKKQGRIGNRKDRQQKRVAGGVASGELTAAEAAKIEAREANLNKQIREDRKDGGKLTVKERKKIEARQDKISKDIHKEKHDKQKQ